ncbi:hypothetical protein Vi05172_g9160 [Venturia inaequalis]|nr:hypothetical protein Vi05172_g9160 [Venturia inaequalis]
MVEEEVTRMRRRSGTFSLVTPKRRIQGPTGLFIDNKVSANLTGLEGCFVLEYGQGEGLELDLFSSPSPSPVPNSRL